MKLLLFLFFSTLIFTNGPAQGEQLKVVKGKIAVDGAAVYSKPDFDSEVVDYLNQGVSVPTSVKQFPGTGGLGLFHKVKTPTGKLGYITDTDITVPKDLSTETAPIPPPRKKSKEKVKEAEKEKPEEKDEDEEKASQRTLYMTKYIGGELSMVDYSEKFSGVTLHTFEPFLNFRLTGPNVILKGMPLDWTFGIYPKPPSYLGQIGSGNASGFLILTNLNIFFPIIDTKTYLVSYGIGPMMTFSDYSVTVGGQSLSSQDLRIGLDVDLGGAYRINNRYALRADAKYYIEKTQYIGVSTSFQVEY